MIRRLIIYIYTGEAVFDGPACVLDFSARIGDYIVQAVFQTRLMRNIFFILKGW